MGKLRLFVRPSTIAAKPARLSARCALLACLAALAILLPVQAQARTEQEESNLQVGIGFYNAVVNDKDWDRAKSLMSDCFVQHSIYAPPGDRGVRELAEMLAAKFPQNEGRIVRSFVDGDTVVLHVHARRTPKVPGWAVIEIMRIEGGKVVEHWDMFQDVPEDSLNENGMF